MTTSKRSFVSRAGLLGTETILDADSSTPVDGATRVAPHDPFPTRAGDPLPGDGARVAPHDDVPGGPPGVLAGRVAWIDAPGEPGATRQAIDGIGEAARIDAPAGEIAAQWNADALAALDAEADEPVAGDPPSIGMVEGDVRLPDGALVHPEVDVTAMIEAPEMPELVQGDMPSPTGRPEEIELSPETIATLADDAPDPAAEAESIVALVQRLEAENAELRAERHKLKRQKASLRTRLSDAEAACGEETQRADAAEARERELSKEERVLLDMLDERVGAETDPVRRAEYFKAVLAFVAVNHEPIVAFLATREANAREAARATRATP